MTFVSMLAIGLLVAFGSSIINLDKQYGQFLNEYGYVDELVSTSLTSREKLKAVQSNVDGIEKLDVRFTLDAYVKKELDGTEGTLTARVFSYNENENELFDRYVLSHIDPNYEKDTNGTFKYINVGLTRKFALNNRFKVGDTLYLGFSDYYIPLFINEIVETTEGIYPRANDYVWSDSITFGYMYVSESELGKGITKLANIILDKISEQATEEEKEQVKKSVEAIIELLGLPNFLDPAIDGTYVSKYGNQVLIKNKAGYTQDDVLKNVLDFYEQSHIQVSASSKGDNLAYRIYMKNVQKQLRVGAIFLPVFFYSVTMIVIGLFMNQIIKNMTSEIGIMMSIGVGKGDIISIFLLFAGIMGIVSGVLGIGLGWGINAYLAYIMMTSYSIPTITSVIRPVVAVLAVVALVAFAELATFISCLAIFKITPKDAVISNESKRKKNPKWVNKIIDKSPMNIKLGLNSMFQNPKRFIVSTFSIFASFVLIMLCCNFHLSKDVMISQSVNSRLNYDCQVYMVGLSDQEQKDEIKSLSCVTAFEDCYYTYLEVEKDGKKTYVESLAIDSNSTQDLVVIPASNGKGKLTIPETGIILPTTTAKVIGAKVGDYINIGKNSIKVEKISYQYFHPISYLSKTQMEQMKANDEKIAYVSSFLVNTNDRKAFSGYFMDNNVRALTVYTDNLKQDLLGNFKSVNVMIYIMIGFAFGIGFVILAIMSQNSLMEQVRSVSVLRLIGFTGGDISRIWSLQSIIQVLSSLVISIPAGVGFSLLLFNLASGPSQIYPFIFSWPIIGISLGFIILTVVICHTWAMLSIKRWNLADNTRSRE